MPSGGIFQGFFELCWNGDGLNTRNGSSGYENWGEKFEWMLEEEEEKKKKKTREEGILQNAAEGNNRENVKVKMKIIYISKLLKQWEPSYGQVVSAANREAWVP